MLDILEVNFNVGQPFYALNNLPPRRLATLRKAFWATVKNPATIKEASSRYLPMNSQTPEQVLAAIDKVSVGEGRQAHAIRQIVLLVSAILQDTVAAWSGQIVEVWPKPEVPSPDED